MREPVMSDATRAALLGYRAKTDQPFTLKQARALVDRARLEVPSAGAPPRVRWSAFIAACVVGAVGYSAAFPRGAVVQQQVTVLTANTRWERVADEVQLRSGKLRVVSRMTGTLAARTVEVVLRLERAAAVLETTSAGTTVVVESGEVAWHAGTRSGRLRAREQQTFARAPPVLVAATGALPVDGCPQNDGHAACLERAASGSGLAAEAALFELGLSAHQRGEPAQAVKHFRACRARFPEGTFAPEVSVSLMLSLHQLGEETSAREEAARFVRAFPSDTRVSAVEQWAAALQ